MDSIYFNTKHSSHRQFHPEVQLEEASDLCVTVQRVKPVVQEMELRVSRLFSVCSCSVWLCSAFRWLLCPFADRQKYGVNQSPFLLLDNLVSKFKGHFILTFTQIFYLWSTAQHFMLSQNSYLDKKSSASKEYKANLSYKGNIETLTPSF